MSSFLTRFFTSIGLLKKRVNWLIVGLDNSGKTTLLHWLQVDDGQPKSPTAQTTASPAPSDVLPTIGFQVDHFSRGKLQVTSFDMSGQGRYRHLWEHYYPDADAILFIIDASDPQRLAVAREELDGLLDHPSLKTRALPILFFANKMDVVGSLGASDVSDVLGLNRIRDKPWHIGACSALTGEGVPGGLQWLTDQLS